MSSEQKKLAVLIDADNSQPKIIEGLLDEIANYGVASVKRIYGDWTDTKLKGWKNLLLEHGIHPMQQFAYTTGKNATDTAMIIDAMDLLYSDKFDGFCIVSSDSDFTRLAIRLREAGMKVFGIGEKKTPTPFIAACDKFIYLEIIKPVETVAKQVVVQKVKSRTKSKTKEAPPAPPVNAIEIANKGLAKVISDSINDLADEKGWAFLGDLGNLILKKQPDFDPRNYGFKKLVPLIKSFDQFEIDERESGKKNTILVFVRTK